MRAAPPKVQDMGVDFIRWTYFIVLSFCAAMALPDLSAGEAKDIAVEGTSVRDKGSVRWSGQEGRIASHVRARSNLDQLVALSDRADSRANIVLLRNDVSPCAQPVPAAPMDTHIQLG